MSINAEKLVKIGLVHAEIFGGMCQFFGRLVQNGAVLPLSGVTGLILTKLAHDISTTLP